MVGKTRVGLLLASTVLGASLVGLPAFAQDGQSQQQMQNQINAMQKQLQRMQGELDQAQKQAVAAQQAVQSVPSGLYNQAPPMATKGPAWFQGIQISMAGSFLALEGVWREHNEVSDGASDPPFANPGIPLPNSVLFHEHEYRMSAQQSRIALKASGDIDPAQHLKGYYEMDFLGAATDANNRESNSFTPRIRQLYAEYDNDNYHFHTAFGQTWSAVTQERVGMLPGNENTPLTIDAQYVVGFNWVRQPTIRLVEDWNKILWFGLSIEQPQGVIGNGSLSPAAVTPAGLTTNVNNTCQGASHLNQLTSCTNDIAPDLVEKIAADPGWGHYEVFGLQRWFTDNVAQVAPLPPTAWSTKVTTGWGIGGSALFPVMPKILDLQGSILYGQGTGRYGSSQFPDVTIGPTGSLSPLQTLQFLVGAIAHPFEGNDIYAYYGQEQVQRDAWGTTGGYGNPGLPNGGCTTEVIPQPAPAFGTAALYNASTATCAFNVQRAQEFTIGFWQDAYKGALGRVRVGAQYEFVQLTAFAGSPTAGLTPNQGLTQNNNIFFFSLRYYPFN